MATDIIARGMAANAKKSVTELGDKVESEKWIGTKAEWEAVDKSTIKDGTIVYITDDETVILYDKAEMEKIATQVATDRKAAETAAQTAQSIADSLPEEYTTAVRKIAENTAEIGRVKLTDKELQRRVNALYDIGQGITHQFETDSDTAYVKTVPTGAKLMSVKSVGGRSIVWNQLFDYTQFVNSTTDGVTFTNNNDGTITIGGTHTSESKIYSVKMKSNPTAVKGHKYIIMQVYDDAQHIRASNAVAEAVSDGEMDLRFSVKPGTTLPQTVTPQLYDLTAMFGSGNEPASVEEFEKMFPTDYYPYNTGEVVSAGTESIIEQGANLYYGTDMLKVGSDTYEYIANSYRCKAIKLKPNTTYTLSFTSDKTSEIILLMNVNTVVNSQPYLDFRKTSDNRSYRTGDNGYLYVGVYAGNGSVMSADVVKRLSECEIMIAESDTPITYAPYHSNVYQIPEAIKALPGYGWSAGTARNYIDYENKKYYKCIDSMDLGTVNWQVETSPTFGTYFSTFVDSKKIKKIGDFTQKRHNILCDKYLTVKRDVKEYVDKTILLDGTVSIVTQIQVKDTAYTDAAAFKQAMQGVILYYELANPIVTDISTLIPDDFLRNMEVEAGGSVTFKGGNDDYRIPVPSEEEYIVKLSEIGGTT